MSSSSSTTDPSSTASTSFDSAQYKIGQRQGWDSVAIGWQKWWKAFEGSAQRLCDKLVELADIGPGQQVLDVATGIGEPTMTAAKRVGANGLCTFDSDRNTKFYHSMCSISPYLDSHSDISSVKYS